MLQYSLSTQNKRAAEAAEKDALLERIVCVLDERNLRLADVRAIDPTIDRFHFYKIKSMQRSVCSVARLRNLLAGLESMAVAA